MADSVQSESSKFLICKPGCVFELLKLFTKAISQFPTGKFRIAKVEIESPAKVVQDFCSVIS